MLSMLAAATRPGSGLLPGLLTRAGTSLFHSTPVGQREPYQPAAFERPAPKNFTGLLEENANTLFLTDVARGLSLTLKTFFDEKVTTTTPLRKALSRPDFAESMCCVGTPLVRNVASPASSARPSVQLKPSTSRQKSVKTVAGVPLAMIST